MCHVAATWRATSAGRTAKKCHVGRQLSIANGTGHSGASAWQMKADSAGQRCNSSCTVATPRKWHRPMVRLHVINADETGESERAASAQPASSAHSSAISMSRQNGRGYKDDFAPGPSMILQAVAAAGLLTILPL